MLSNPEPTFVPIEGGEQALDGFPSEALHEKVLVQWDAIPLAAAPRERLSLAEPVPRRTTSAISFFGVAVLTAALMGGVWAWRLPATEPPLAGPNVPVAEMAATSQPPAAASSDVAPAPANKGGQTSFSEDRVFTSTVTAKAAGASAVAAEAPSETRRSRDAVRFSPMLAPAPPPVPAAQIVQRTAPQSAPAAMPVAAPAATIATFGSRPSPDPIRPEPAVARPDPAPSRPEPAQARPETAAPVAPASAAARAPVPAPLPRVDEDAAVRAVLGRYRDAYDRLDADAAKRVWPGVDARALSRAFASLESQSITFDECRTTVMGVIATAACRGSATYVGRLGNRNSQTQNRQWTFTLQKDGSDWTVQRVQVH